MNSDVRALVKDAEMIGWKFDGYDGSGHVVLSNVNGQRTSIPSTPSEYRSLTNSRSLLERLAGRKFPRAGKRRASRKGEEVSGFSVVRAMCEGRSRRAAEDRQREAKAELEELRQACQFAATASRNSADPRVRAHYDRLRAMYAAALKEGSA